MQTLKTSILLIFVLSVVSCATVYKPVDLRNKRRGNQTTSNGVTLTYNYDVLKKGYGKKEHEKKIRVIQIEINNQSGNDLIFGKDLKITESNGEERYLLSNDKIFNSLKQHPAGYLFYLVLTPLPLNNDVNPIGYVLGPLLALGNLIMAANANNKFRVQLEQTNLQGQIIKNGTTVFGLIGINAEGSQSLGVRIIIPEE